MKKTSIVFLMMALMIALLSACSKEASVETDSKSLLLYGNHVNKIIDIAITEYKLNFPEVDVELRRFENYRQFQDNLTTDLLSGSGPDVIIFDNFVLGSKNNIIDANIFADINEFIQNDDDFNIENYQQKVLDIGIHEDKRLFMPINYRINGMLTTESILQKYNFSEENLRNLKAFLSIIQEKEKSGDERYLFSDPVMISDILGGRKLIDGKTQNICIDKETFRMIADTNKYINDNTCGYEEYNKYNNQRAEMLNNGQLLFINDSFMALDFIEATNAVSQHYTNEEIKLISFPTLDNSLGNTAYPQKNIGINRNSHNQEGAYNFIKTMLSREVQSSRYFIYLPVNNTVLNSHIVKYETARPMMVNFNKVDMVFNPLSEELLKSYRSILDNIDTVVYRDMELDGILYKYMHKYANESNKLDQIYEEFCNELSLYMHE